MEEAADAGLENGDPVLTGRQSDTLVANGTAGMRDVANPGSSRPVHVVTERDERVRAETETLEPAIPLVALGIRERLRRVAE